MADTTVKTTKRITLVLNGEEAQDLRDLLNDVSDDWYDTTEEVFHALGEVVD